MDATLGLPVLVGLIAVALLFDLLNGVHDAANSIATIVSTRVLRPQYAVIWAAFFNFVAFTVFGLHVANTIGTGIIEPSIIDAQVIFAALIGVYIVIRFGAQVWPATHQVHISEPIGAFNTFVLICSSVTIVLSLLMGHVQTGAGADEERSTAVAEVLDAAFRPPRA